MIHTFKKDNYSKARNSYSRLINVICRKCTHLIFVYQKDGPGNLRRLYYDRIYNLKDETEILKCNNCQEILGTPYIYEKENRKAFRIYQDAVVKKIIKK